MRVIVACEFSGRVRDAFALRGHDAWSCDLLPSETTGKHIQGDALLAIGKGWDLLIGHPPCTFLSRAGAHLRTRPGRTEARDEAMAFFMALWNAPVARVCIENPEGFPRSAFRHPDQVINPFDFGNPVRKKTLLWLRGLPPLFSTMMTQPLPPQTIDARGKRRHYTDSLSSSDKKGRSRTFLEIAEAMAEQWG